MKKVLKIIIVIFLLSIQELSIQVMAQPAPPISFDINKFKNLLIAAIKFTATIAIIIVFAFMAIRSIKGGIEYQLPSGLTVMGIREILDAFKKPIIFLVVTLLAVWFPDLLVYLGVLPNAPFTVNWQELWSGG